FYDRLRSDGFGVQTAILRASRQIYEEASCFLYGSFPFSIRSTQSSLSMCGRTQAVNRSRRKPDAPVPSSGRAFPGVDMPGQHMLQHQMRSMSLGQQSTRRLLMVREPKEQDFSSTEYATTWKPAISEAC